MKQVLIKQANQQKYPLLYLWILTFLFVLSINTQAQRQPTYNGLPKKDNIENETDSFAGNKEGDYKKEFINFSNLGNDNLTFEQAERIIEEKLNLKNGVNELRIFKATTLQNGIEVRKFQQYIKGIKVEHGRYAITAQQGNVQFATGNVYEQYDRQAISPSISETEALTKAIEYINADTYMWEAGEESEPTGELVWIEDWKVNNKEKKSLLHLAYKFNIYAMTPLSRDLVYVRATDGKILFKNPIIKHCKHGEHLNKSCTKESVNIYKKSKLAADYLLQTGTGMSLYSGPVDIEAEPFGSDFRLQADISANNLASRIETYNMNNGVNYISATDFLDDDNNWSSDASIDAHWGAKTVYDYWATVHNRNSYDDNGTSLRSYVHFLFNFDNAFWDGEKMTYGDGNVLGPLVGLDVVAHEIGHGICTSTSDLIYEGESGAMNESFSDIWAACIERWAIDNNYFTFDMEVAKDEWLIGEEIGGAPFSSYGAIRTMVEPNMSNPPQPDTYEGLHWRDPNCSNPSQSNDYCGVHFNSGIMNKMFYLLVMGGTGTNDDGYNYNVTGIGFEDAEAIAYLTIQNMAPTDLFHDALIAFDASTTMLFGASSPERSAVIEAWHAVGVYIETEGNCNFNMVQRGNGDNYTIVGTDYIKTITNHGTDYTDLETDIGLSDNYYYTFRLNLGEQYIAVLNAQGGNFSASENGNITNLFGTVLETYDENSTFKIEFIDGTLSFYVDDRLFQTTNTILNPISNPLTLRTYLLTPEAQVIDLQIHGCDDCISDCPNDPPTTPCLLDIIPQGDADGFHVTGDEITKTITKNSPSNEEAIALTDIGLQRNQSFIFTANQSEQYIAVINSEGAGFFLQEDYSIDIFLGDANVETYTETSLFEILLTQEGNLLFYVDGRQFHELNNVDPDAAILRLRMVLISDNAQIKNLQVNGCDDDGSDNPETCEYEIEAHVDANGFTVSGSATKKTILKTDPTGLGNAVACTTTELLEGYYYLFKLRNGTQSISALNSGNGFWANQDGTIDIVGGDSNVANYTDESVFKIELVDNDILFYVDEFNFHTNSNVDPSTDNIRFRTSLLHQNTQVVDLELYGCDEEEIEICDIDYNIINHYGIDINGNIITKTYNTGWSNGGRGNTVEAIGEGEYIQYQVLDATRVFVGLSAVHEGVSWQTIDFALFAESDGTLSVYENNVNVAEDLGNYTSSSMIEIRIESGQVWYYLDGQALDYQSTLLDPNASLIVEFYIIDKDAQIIDLVMYNDCTTPEVEFCQAGHNIINHYGIDINGNIITKTYNTGWSNGGRGNTIETIGSGEYIQYQVLDATRVFVGLSAVHEGASWQTIDFALFAESDGTLSVYENNNKVAEDLGNYTSSSVLELKVQSGQVWYYLDGQALSYQSTLADPNASLIVEFYIIDKNHQIIDLSMLKECQSSSARVVNTLDANMKEQENILSQTKLYPNPTNNQFNIDFSEDITFPVQLQMFSLRGQQVMTKELNQYTNVFQTDNLAKGVYFIRLQEKDKIQQLKLVVQ